MKKWTLYNLFHSGRDDLEPIREEDTTPTLSRFFKLFGRRFWKLVSVNLIMLPMIIPLLVAFYLYISVDKTPSAGNLIFPQLYGITAIQKTAGTTFLMDLFGAQVMIPVYGNTGTYVGIILCFLFLMVTFGWQNVGATYLLRSLVRGDPIFLFADYFYAVKKNLRQGFLLGLLDFWILFLLAFDFLYFWSMTGSFWNDVMFFAIFALFIIYFFMRFYLYLMQITFNLSIRKLLKNALIFVTLGIKRNLMAVLGMIVLTAITVGVIAAFLPLNFAVPLILPFFFYLSFCAFMSAYAAYPVIERYMITPYLSDSDSDGDEDKTKTSDVNESIADESDEDGFDMDADEETVEEDESPSTDSD